MMIGGGFDDNRRIKVMQVTHDLKIGGLQRVVVDIARRLDRSRYDVSVCALREAGPLERELIYDGIQVITLPPAVNGTDYLTFWKLFRIFQATAPDIVHTHNTQPFVEGGAAAHLARVPSLIHTDHGRQFPDKRRYMLAERIMSHCADRIVAVSDSVKKDLIEYEGISGGKIVVVPNGVEDRKKAACADRSVILRALGVEGKNRTILGFAGRLAPEKGIFCLCEAVHRIIGKNPDVLLLIAGGGALLEPLKTYIRRRTLEPHIKLIGPREDMDEIMGVFDIFVLPSLREGLPLALLEASAAGLPIVATNVGGCSAVVKTGVNGYVVEPGDAAALGRAIEQLVQNQEQRGAFGRESRRLFERHFTITRMLNDYDALYRDCTSGRRSAAGA